MRFFETFQAIIDVVHPPKVDEDADATMDGEEGSDDDDYETEEEEEVEAEEEEEEDEGEGNNYFRTEVDNSFCLADHIGN